MSKNPNLSNYLFKGGKIINPFNKQKKEEERAAAREKELAAEREAKRKANKEKQKARDARRKKAA